MTNTKTIHIRLPHEHVKQIEKIAKKTHRPISNTVAFIVIKWLEREAEFKKQDLFKGMEDWL